jgi:hypothetical protein
MSTDVEEIEETALATIDTVKDDLAIIQNVTIADLFKAETINPMLDKIEVRVRAVPVDISTAKGRQQIITLTGLVTSSKTFIDAQRKVYLKDQKDYIKKIDKCAGETWDRLEKLQHETRAPLTVWETEDKERVARHESNLAELEAFGTFEFSVTTSEIQIRLAQLEAVSTDGFEEYERRAEAAKTESLAKLNAQLEVSRMADMDRAELEQLRAQAAERAAQDARDAIAKAAREEAEAKAERARVVAEAKANAEKLEAAQRIVKAENDRLQAIEDAKVAAEKAEAARLAVIAKTEADRLAQIEQAKQDAIVAAAKAEEDRIAAEQKAEADKAAAVEAERTRVFVAAKAEADAETKRESNKRHVNKFKKDAVKALVAFNLTEELSAAIVEQIAEGKIPHVSISY